LLSQSKVVEKKPQNKSISRFSIRARLSIMDGTGTPYGSCLPEEHTLYPFWSGEATTLEESRAMKAAHREWMTRSYALTFGGVMLMVWVPIFGAMGIDFTTGYIVVAWLAWIPNLMVAQWIIDRIRRGQRCTKKVGLPGITVSVRETAQTDL
jgi:predicted membrane protein DUF2306